MKETKRKNWICFIILLATGLNINAQNLDIDIVKKINPNKPDNGFWKVASGSAYFVSAAVPIGLLAEGLIKKDPILKRKAYDAFSSIIMELVISESMKVVCDRKRPAELYPMVVFPYRNVTGKSFPSGHTSLVFASAASLSIECKKWYITVAAYSYAALVGYSRIYLGVHYPSDVIAGSIVGVGSAYLSHWLNKKVFTKTKNKFHSKTSKI